MKFKLDENMPADLGTWLHDLGHDVSDVHDEGLAGEDDKPVLRAAVSEGRILVTFDLDFADIRTYPPGSHCGIVVFRLRDQRWATIKAPLSRLFEKGSFEKLENGLAVVDEVRVRWKRGKAR